METQADDSQDKIKVRLEILPEKQSLENRTLAREIAHDIFEHLDQAQDYSIKAHHTGAMGGGSEFWVWIVPGVAFISLPGNGEIGAWQCLR